MCLKIGLHAGNSQLGSVCGSHLEFGVELRGTLRQAQRRTFAQPLKLPQKVDIESDSYVKTACEAMTIWLGKLVGLAWLGNETKTHTQGGHPFQPNDSPTDVGPKLLRPQWPVQRIRLL